MFVEILPDDDDHFVAIVNRIIQSSLRQYSPEVLKVVRIDNWFSRRWRGFAGKALGAVRMCSGRLVIPPFVPSRVVTENSWSKAGDYYAPLSPCKPLHQNIRSEENLKRYFDQQCPDTIALWFSSQSRASGRGSVMLYSSAGTQETFSWYLELTNAKGWKPTFLSGISRQELPLIAAQNSVPAEQGGSQTVAASRASF